MSACIQFGYIFVYSEIQKPIGSLRVSSFFADHTKSLLLLLTIIALWWYLGNIVINALTSQFLIMNIIASNHYEQVRTSENYHGHGLRALSMHGKAIRFSFFQFVSLSFSRSLNNNSFI